MDSASIDRLKTYAASTRSHLSFGGATTIPFDWKSGKYLVGKAKTDFTGQKFVVNVPNTMVGFRQWPQGGKPDFALTLLLDPSVEPIERSELGRTDETQWIGDPPKDPWVPVTALVLYPEETRQVYVLIAAYGERSEAGNVIDAFVDHNRDRAEANEELPIVQLCARPYVKKDGTDAFAMQLDLNGGWTARAAAVLKISPPPLKITTTESPQSNGRAASEFASVDSSKPKSSDDKAAKPKPKRKVTLSDKSDIDDEIPF